MRKAIVALVALFLILTFGGLSYAEESKWSGTMYYGVYTPDCFARAVKVFDFTSIKTDNHYNFSGIGLTRDLTKITKSITLEVEGSSISIMDFLVCHMKNLCLH